jgi:hypothetical protein
MFRTTFASEPVSFYASLNTEPDTDNTMDFYDAAI